MQLSRQAATRIREKASRKTSKEFICRRKERKKEICEDSGAIQQTSSTIKERRKAQGFPSSARTTRGTTQWDVKEGNQGKIQELRESSTCIPCNGTRYQVLQDNQDQATR